MLAGSKNCLVCLVQVVRQGTRLGLQVQLAWALLLLLGALEARAYLAQAWHPQSHAAQAAMGAVPVLAGVLLLAGLIWQPWRLEPPPHQAGCPVHAPRMGPHEGRLACNHVTNAQIGGGGGVSRCMQMTSQGCPVRQVDIYMVLHTGARPGGPWKPRVTSC